MNDWDGIEWFDGQRVHRDSAGRVTHIGDRPVSYDQGGRPATVGGESVTYGPDGQPFEIGSSTAFQVSPDTFGTTGAIFGPAAGLVVSGHNINSKPVKRPPAGGSDVARSQRACNIKEDSVAIWGRAGVLLLPAYLLLLVMRYGPLFFLRDPSYLRDFWNLALLFLASSTLVTVAAVFQNYKSPAEPVEDGWQVKRLLEDDEGRHLPIAYAVLLLPAWVTAYICVLVLRRWIDNPNIWYLLPALVLPGVAYFALQVKRQWKMRQIHYRYFGTVIVSSIHVVHNSRVQDDSGQPAKEPPSGFGASASLCFALVVLGLLVQSR